MITGAAEDLSRSFSLLFQCEALAAGSAVLRRKRRRPRPRVFPFPSSVRALSARAPASFQAACMYCGSSRPRRSCCFTGALSQGRPGGGRRPRGRGGVGGERAAAAALRSVRDSRVVGPRLLSEQETCHLRLEHGHHAQCAMQPATTSATAC